MILPALLSVALLTLAAPTFAGPPVFGNALQQAAEAGLITPRGVWDSK